MVSLLPQGVECCAIDPYAASGRQRLRGGSNGNVYRVWELHRARHSQRQGFAQKEGSLQGNGEAAGSDGEGPVLDFAEYDIVLILEAQDDAAVAELGLSLGKLGNVRTQTMRAFGPAEVTKLLDKMV